MRELTQKTASLQAKTSPKQWLEFISRPNQPCLMKKTQAGADFLQEIQEI
jgi:hypothetical protein